ncbi:hypothetical protein [Pseudoxanthomonas suwonensis]|uniref:hypothetical protein n=1 Tax=Pseudoxanthomonas suwonensis TaxID=314722 RepID=UPI00048E521E|nr:hypothetical protein [Pseudoxanthomonas suwonensis]
MSVPAAIEAQDGTPATAKPRARWPWRALAGTYAVAVLALCGMAIHAYGLYCEGFGCVAIGILWFAWACVSPVVLLAGVLAWWRLRPGRWAWLVAGALAVQLLSAGWLAWAWLGSRSAPV